MWYFIINLILRLYNILGLVSGKFGINRLIEQLPVEVQQVCLLRGALIMSIIAAVLAIITSTWTCLDSQSFDPLTIKFICPERRIFSLYNWQFTIGNWHLELRNGIYCAPWHNASSDAWSCAMFNRGPWLWDHWKTPQPWTIHSHIIHMPCTYIYSLH